MLPTMARVGLFSAGRHLITSFNIERKSKSGLPSDLSHQKSNFAIGLSIGDAENYVKLRISIV